MPGNCLFLFLAGELTAGLFILMAGYFKKPDVVICYMCVAGAAAGAVYAGFQVNVLDIAPRNASVVMVFPLAEHDSNVSRHWNQYIARIRSQVSLKILTAF